MYCSIAQVRGSSNKLENETDVTDLIITGRITEAESQIKADLSEIISEADLDALGSDSKVVNLMAIYKAVEKTLIYYYGIYRKANEIGDTDYFAKQYDRLLKKVIEGEISVTDDTGTDYGAADYPKATSSNYNLKLYPRKGIPGFTPEGADGSYEDDENL